MAPTEVLAEQHYLAVACAARRARRCRPRARCSASGRCGSSCSPTARPRPSAAASPTGLRGGEVDILVGTHALLYGDAEFTRLGRRGDRRAAPLRRRAARRCCAARATQPDVLVMTATPIPRTAAMLIYGDLDKSELREMPPGRTPIATEVVGPEPARRRSRRASALRAEVAAGPPGVRRVPARRGQGQGRGARPRPRSSSGSQAEELAGPAARAAARPDAVGGEGGGDGRVPRRRDRRARRDDRDRGRRRRARTRR